jgi:hypothetical protein
MTDTIQGTSAVDGSSATMFIPFIPLCYQAIIMVEEIEMKSNLLRVDRIYSTISSYLTENRVAVMRKTGWRQ